MWASLLAILRGLVALATTVADAIRNNRLLSAGRAEQAAADSKAAADAGKRIADATAQPHDSATTQGRLDDGTF